MCCLKNGEKKVKLMSFGNLKIFETVFKKGYFLDHLTLGFIFKFHSVVQSADWKFGATNTGKQPKYVQDAALATFVLCILGLIGYTVYSVCHSVIVLLLLI